MQAALLELNAAEVVDSRGVRFHFFQLRFHLGLRDHLWSSAPTIRDFHLNLREPQRDQMESRR